MDTLKGVEYFTSIPTLIFGTTRTVQLSAQRAGSFLPLWKLLGTRLC
jgi:hypothetical protein